jgi:hypothetical protein
VVSTTARGTAVWATAAWRERAVAWLDAVLAGTGATRTGAVTQPHLRPWATALRAPTTAGVVWLKAAAAGTAVEVAVYDVLVRVAPDRVLTPIATDPVRGWIVLPDGGPTLRDRVDGIAQIDGLAEAMRQYGAVQRTLAVHVDDLLAAGVADMRPVVMPDRFEEALDVTAAMVRTADDREVHRRVAALRPSVTSWCAALAAAGPPASLDHNDLHPDNVLVGDDGTVRFYDWGDSVIAHPFAALLVPLEVARGILGTDRGDPRVGDVVDAYLAGVAPEAGSGEPRGTVATACLVAWIARTLTGDRALRMARADGDPTADEWSRTPLDTLAALLDAVDR